MVNAIVLIKIAWSFVFFTPAGALDHLVPAALGLGVCNAVLVAAWFWLTRSRAAPSA